MKKAHVDPKPAIHSLKLHDEAEICCVVSCTREVEYKAMESVKKRLNAYRMTCNSSKHMLPSRSPQRFALVKVRKLSISVLGAVQAESEAVRK